MAVAIKMNKGKKVSQIVTRSCNDYLIEFLQSKNTFLKLYGNLEKAMTSALPENVGENCRKCKPELFDKDSFPKEAGVTVLGNCDFYRSQMGVTYLLAANEFIRIIKSNELLFQNKIFLKKLTFQFFACFGYIKGKGIMVFDLSKLCNKLLENGFMLISAIFSKSDSLKNLNIINDTIDSIDTSLVKIKLYNSEDLSRLELQREFFSKKKEFYKEKLWLDQYAKPSRPKNFGGIVSARPNRTDIAYYCYYTSETKELKTNNLFPTKKAWKEIGELFGKDDTNIQKAYNKIYSSKTERLKNTKTRNIEYVLDNMLATYPKAKKLALDELKLAIID
ncbi:hypothetical protein FGM00_08370 [Aggregatimonas sangjinii]|uniref:Uncharacterized protein n=1 Tax=Aggregatimonas sangjinii TaxID=2583587 RepID=A0A5B7SNL8_9FLAO|nr:hypothetical protein [Aggregatimonas sangjinii]QCX00117.1 hypothetical protein FGM00_08370 [Aggregatimonas sangjinii]